MSSSMFLLRTICSTRCLEGSRASRLCFSVTGAIDAVFRQMVVLRICKEVSIESRRASSPRLQKTACISTSCASCSLLLPLLLFRQCLLLRVSTASLPADLARLTTASLAFSLLAAGCLSRRRSAGDHGGLTQPDPACSTAASSSYYLSICSLAVAKLLRAPVTTIVWPFKIPPAPTRQLLDGCFSSRDLPPSTSPDCPIIIEQHCAYFLSFKGTPC